MADSNCVIGTPVTQAAVGAAADCTSPNGNGHSEVVADSGSVVLSFADPLAVLSYTGNGDSGLTTGYVQSDTAGRGVIRITTNQVFDYHGTGSTLVSLAAATDAETLFLAGRSVSATTGTLTALGTGSTALHVTAHGAAGLGAIAVTVDGDVSSAGKGLVLDQNDSAATGNVTLTSSSGNTITSGAGAGVAVVTSGAGTITVDLADLVSATGGAGISVRNSAKGGNIAVTAAAVSALSAGEDGINIQSLATSGNVAVTANGAISAGDEGIRAGILDAAATGNLRITVNSTIDAQADGIDALNSGSGTITVEAHGSVTAAKGDGILARSSGGAISVTANTATSGGEQGIDVQQTNAAGSGALSVTTNDNISGTDGIRVLNGGTGGVTITATRGITGFAGDAINVVSTNAAAGAIKVVTSAGQQLNASGGQGIDVDQSGAGNVIVENGAAVGSGGAASGFLAGVDVTSTGTGNISITNTGAIGTAGDRAQGPGLIGAITNADSAGTVSISGTGALRSALNGIDVFVAGSGAASVNYSGTIDASGGDAIQVDTTSGAITVSSSGAISAAAGNGIRTASTSGNQTITVDGAVSGGTVDGVRAAATSGTILIDISGGNVSAADDAIDVSSNGAKNINVAVGRTLTGGDLGIASTGTGATAINNGGTITGTGVAIRSETGATALVNSAGATINGAISLSASSDTVSNSGAIVGAVNLGAGNDLYDGRNGTVSGTISGNDGNDTIIGGAGNERMSGGAGLDTAIYLGLFRSFNVNLHGGSGSVSGGGAGNDSLNSMELVRFTDGLLTFDADSASAQVARLYDTVLQRDADDLGLDYWVDRIEDDGAGIGDVAQAFLNSAEFQARTGNLSNADYVEFLYQNALGRASDSSGKAYWVGQLNSGAQDRADLLVGFSESTEHRGLTADLVANGFFVTDDAYQAVALLYDSFANRLPDAQGLIYWSEAVEAGTLTLDQVADLFASSPEFSNLTAGMSNSELVDFMYQNTLDRPSDASGRAYWVQTLENGADRGDLLIGFSQSLEHFNLLGSSITNGIDYFTG